MQNFKFYPARAASLRIDIILRAPLSQENNFARSRALFRSSSRNDASPSNREIAFAISCSAYGSNNRPAPPTTSGNEPRLLVATGSPQAIASTTGNPKPSLNDGSTS